MKRIVICCDGTWNYPDKNKQGIPIPTNVVKVAEAVKAKAEDGVVQLMYYDPGVGTSGSKLQRLFDGATGNGLSDNICKAYHFLVLNYVEGDELFFFGFSRGAFTVRSLAGLIRNSGILWSVAIDMLERAFSLYRSRSAASHPREKEATLFRRTYAVSDIVPIKFIGVWDTVGSLGNPLLLNGFFSRRQRFHDTQLSSTVANAFQALAIDEKRLHFKATLWQKQAHATNQNLEQVWFVGAHSNIGGGTTGTGLSDLALEWLCTKARLCGLDLKAIEPHPDLLEPVNESRKGFYRLIPKYYRPIAKSTTDQGATNESLHPSVLRRHTEDAGYRPKNLEAFFTRNA